MLKTLISDTSGFDSATVPLTNNSFRDDRYMYYQDGITEEPKVADNYVRMINYLREYVKKQDTDACSVELFDDIIRWAEQLIARCYKTPSKANDKQIVKLIQAEAYIHIGKLAEATEILLKCNRFWIHSSYSYPIKGNKGTILTGGYHIIAWNLYAAFRRINYTRGCDLLISKTNKSEIEKIETSNLGKLFTYPIVQLENIESKKAKHMHISWFYEEDSRNPAFYIDRFYKKSPEEYAKEIDNVLKLHGIV